MPKRRNKKPQARPERPLRIKWEFDPDVPTEDLVGERDLSSTDDLDEVVEDFISTMEEGDFLVWEAVMADEQGLRLTKKQHRALRDLLNFGDPQDDRILYIDEIPRPSQPWYVLLNRIVPHLVVEPYRTSDVHWDVQIDGWPQLARCVAGHGDGLTLPEGVASPLEVVPVELRHKLWLQFCFGALEGLGQDETMTLADPDEHYRIAEFIECLRAHKDSVQHFDLTLDSLLTRVILPERDRPIFVGTMLERLKTKSTAERIVDYL